MMKLIHIGGGSLKTQLHIISTGKQTKEAFIEKVIALQAEGDFIHIRERSWTAKEIIDTVKTLVASGVPLKKIIINARVDVSAYMHTRRVQLASHRVSTTYVNKHDPRLRIGSSVHRETEAIDQEKAGADYLLYGHIFKTDSKKGSDPRGVESLRAVIEHVSIPVVAIGGITPETVSSVIQAGANGVAVLSGILLKKDAVGAARKYQQALEGLK